MAIQRSGRFERIKKPLKSDMNVVPYIDVMLVLLVIFMITTPIITQGVKVELPKSAAEPTESTPAGSGSEPVANTGPDADSGRSSRGSHRREDKDPEWRAPWERDD